MAPNYQDTFSSDDEGASPRFNVDAAAYYGGGGESRQHNRTYSFVRTVHPPAAPRPAS
jgi:hypothetical protein